MAQKNIKGIRLDKSNLVDYLQKTYGSVYCSAAGAVKGYKPLLQKDYGGINDCTLTCITALIANDRDPAQVYAEVEKVARQYHYNNKIGSIPIFTKSVLDKLTKKNTHSAYGKGIGYSWSKIKNLIKSNSPIILSIYNDGRNYYRNHSVTIVGYKEYNGGRIKILSIYDNWKDTVSYIDFAKLSTISSINYL